MLKRDPYDPNVQLENAAILFLNHRAFPVAAALFSYLLSRRPSHTQAWYGLANGLLMHAASQSQRPFLLLALQCLRRALQEDPANQMAAELVELIRVRSGLSPDDFAVCPAYTDQPDAIRAQLEFGPDPLVHATQTLAAWEDRLQVVMWLGLQGIADFVPLLIACAEHDPHPQVRMAAIKRLKVWAHLPEVRGCFERLVQGGQWQPVQPYLSLALKGVDAEWSRRLLAEIGDIV